MDVKKNLLTDLLQCGCRDINYLIDVLEKNDLQLDVEDVKANFWEVNVNTLIYEALYQVAEIFIAEFEDEICRLLGDGAKTDELYEIYVNYMDSHIWFHDERVHELFEHSKYWA